MKRPYWKVEGKYWEWEKTEEIYIYGLSGVSNNEVEKVIDILNDVINEFTLPLSVKNGNIHRKDNIKKIEQLIRQCSDKDGKIDFVSLEGELYKLRKENKVLPYGTVILVDETKYRFSMCLADQSDPADIASFCEISPNFGDFCDVSKHSIKAEIRILFIFIPSPLFSIDIS